MLGSPCSPCCGTPECDDDQRQALFDLTCSRSCEITLAPGLPYQDAATFGGTPSIVAIDGLGASQTSSQWLADNFYLLAFRQHATASGTHSLSLDMSASQMFSVNGVMAGLVVFRKDTNDYSISVEIDVGWPNIERQQFTFPGTQCLGSMEAQVTLYLERTNFYSKQSPPFGITTATRPLPYLVNGNTINWQVAYPNAPYFRRLDFPTSPGIVSDQGAPSSFDAIWDTAVMLPGMVWRRFEHSNYRWSPSLESAGGFVNGMMFSFGEVPRTPRQESPSRWGPYSTQSIRPDWVSGINIGPELVNVGGWYRFPVQYSQADKFYSAAQLSSAALQSSSIVLA